MQEEKTFMTENQQHLITEICLGIAQMAQNQPDFKALQESKTLGQSDEPGENPEADQFLSSCKQNLSSQSKPFFTNALPQHVPQVFSKFSSQ